MTPENFAVTDDDAAARFAKWKSIDPFPDIPAALLNSADIVNYVRETGMLCPFRPVKNGEDKLKTASYEVDILGEFTLFDPKTGNKRTQWISEGQTFCLPSNSIGFIQMEPVLRVPSYIALRFNLKITHVYRGLLLGTGPLIDPEFEGPFYIPLHNLTDNDYEFEGGEGLIWMEFTKLSMASCWLPQQNPQIERYTKIVGFPGPKKHRNLEYYLNKAAPHRPIRSSIPTEIERSAKSARDAAKAASRMRWTGYIAALALIIGMGSFIFTALNFVNTRAGQIEIRIRDLENRINGRTPQIVDVPLKVDNQPRNDDAKVSPSEAIGKEEPTTNAVIKTPD